MALQQLEAGRDAFDPIACSKVSRCQAANELVLRGLRSEDVMQSFTLTVRTQRCRWLQSTLWSALLICVTSFLLLQRQLEAFKLTIMSIGTLCVMFTCIGVAWNTSMLMILHREQVFIKAIVGNRYFIRTVQCPKTEKERLYTRFLHQLRSVRPCVRTVRPSVRPSSVRRP